MERLLMFLNYKRMFGKKLTFQKISGSLGLQPTSVSAFDADQMKTFSFIKCFICILFTFSFSF